MCMSFGYNPHVNFCQFFLLFPFSFFFSDLMTIRIHNLCVQLLQFSTDYYDIWQAYILHSLKICIGFWGYPAIIFTNCFSTCIFFSFRHYCPPMLLEGAIKMSKPHNPLLTEPWRWGTLAHNGLLWNIFLLFPRKWALIFHTNSLQQIGDNLHELSKPVFWRR